MKETLDTLSLGDLQLLQAKNGYRYSLDPVLLARFVRVKPGACVVDLGAGAAILSLLLARLTSAGRVTGVELQADLAERGRRNVTLNQLEERVAMITDDIRRISTFLPAGKADLVVANPPYHQTGSGRLAPGEERAAARHELAGGLEDFAAAAAWTVKYGGQVAFIFPAERLPALIDGLLKQQIEPKRLRMVHPRWGQSARLVMLEGRKGGRPGLKVEPPLCIYRQEGQGRQYSDELLRMYDL
jgi:tRNA1Val (adenine37-N6)-methyltransferase